ncbi:MAG: hypothetical protein AABX73_02680 [Nanoarchaeota archaeon]
MNLKDRKNKKTAEIIGYVIMYFIFTTILYFILRFLERIPPGWSYFHVMGISILVVLIGRTIKIFLR